MNRSTFRYLACLALVAISVVTPSYGAGVTLVTHGYQPLWVDESPEWLANMVDAVISQNISGSSTRYKITVSSADWITLQAVSSSYGGTLPTSSSSGEIVVELDWSQVSGALGFEASTADIAALIRQCFNSSSFFPSLGRPVAELPIHLIGHSRGGCFVAQLAEDLGKDGLWVNQVTTLDPHPVETGTDTVLGLRPMRLRENVLFADNYRQIWSWPDGKTISGSYLPRTWWNGVSHLLSGYNNAALVGGMHSDVHLWYHGTVDLRTPTSNGGKDITASMRSDTGWYQTDPNEAQGAKTGYYYSRVKGGTYSGGTRSGVSSFLPTGTRSRDPWNITASGASVWDSIEIVDFETDISRQQGNSFQVNTWFFDLNNDAAITWGLDSDRNPYNGVYGSALSSRSTASLGGNQNTDRYRSETLSTASVAAGAYYVYAKISNGTRTRYYYSHARLNVTASTAPPTAINLTLNLSKATANPGEQITASGSATYNNSGGSVPAGTVVITVDGQSYTASINNGSYSQPIYAPNSAGSYTVSATGYDTQSRQGSASRTLTVQSGSGGNGWAIDYAYMCAQIRTRSSFPQEYPDDIRSVFASSDSSGYVYYMLKNISGAHSISFRWYRPDGSHYGTINNSFGESGWDYDNWYVWAGYDISGYDISNIEGRWTIKVYINGSYVESKTFTIRFEFREHKMAEGVQSSDPWNPINPKNVFTQADTRALTWCKLDNVAERLEVKWMWYEPNGSLYDEYVHVGDSPGSGSWFDWFKFWGWTDINGYLAANKCGDWRVDVYIKNPWGNWDKKYADHFRILESPAIAPQCSATRTPANPQETQSVTLNVTATDNTYLKKVTLHWNDGTPKEQSWDNLFSGSLNQSKTIGSFAPGTRVEYWVVATDTSGNVQESARYSFAVQQELMTPPNTPTGSSDLEPGEFSSFSTTGGSSSLGASLEYQFDWGNEAQSEWGSNARSYAWTTEGTYIVRARVRSQPRPARISDWSDGLSVIVSTGIASVVTPTLTPDGGSHPGPSVIVTVSCGTVDATVRYTTDGNEPTESSPTVVSGGTVSVPVPGTLKARAWKDGMTPSTIKSATYSQQGDPDPPPASGWRYPRNDRIGHSCLAQGSTVQSGGTLALQRAIPDVKTVLTGDVDGDGAVDVVTCSGAAVSIYDGAGTLKRTFAVAGGSFLAMLEDADGDGVLDMFLGGDGAGFAAYVYKGDGTLLKTFAGQHAGGTDVNIRPIAFSNGKVFVGYNAGYASTPRGFAAFDYATAAELWYYQIGPANGNYSVADIDGDGNLDATMGSYTVHNGASGNGTTDGDLYLIVVDETGVAKLSQIYGAPSDGAADHVFADLTGDGQPEIIGLRGHDASYYPGQARVETYNSAGAVLHTFYGPDNNNWLGNMCAVGDLDGDGQPEIVATAGPSFTTYVLDSNLNKLAETNLTGQVKLVGDLTGDGPMEIVLFSDGGLLRVLDWNLNVLAALQVGTTGGDVIADDINGDGVIELLCRTDSLYFVTLGHESWDSGYQSLGGGWRRLAWFGDYVPMGGEGWIWHNKHGFFFVPANALPESIWLYAQDMGWLWTSSTTYPFLYRNSDGAWLWYNGGTNPRWFVNMATGQWESWQ